MRPSFQMKSKVKEADSGIVVHVGAYVGFKYKEGLVCLRNFRSGVKARNWPVVVGGSRGMLFFKDGNDVGIFPMSQKWAVRMHKLKRWD